MADYLSPAKVGLYDYLAPAVAPAGQVGTPIRFDFTASYAILAPVFDTPSSVTSITVTPNTVTLAGGGKQQFIATVVVNDSNANTGVEWSTSAGSISQLGLLTAPASAASEQVILVRATSTQDTRKWTEATVRVEALPVLSGDTQSPTIPGTLTVSDVSTSGFTVKWLSGADNIAVTGYDISVDTGTPAYSAYGLTLTANLFDLLPSTTYTVRVRAYDAAGNKSTALTTQVTTATPIDSSVPVWGVSSLISISSITSAGFTTSWPAATDNVGVVSYEVSVDTGTPLFVTAGAQRTKTVVGLLSGTTYNVRVRAVDGNGNVSLPITSTVVTSGIAPLGESVASVLKLKESASVLSLSALSATPVVIIYKSGTGQELVLFNNSDNGAVANLKGSAAGAVTTKGLAGVTIDLSGGLPISVPGRQFVTLKLDNANAYLAGSITLTANVSGAVVAGILQ